MSDIVAMSKEETRNRVPMVLSPLSDDPGLKNLSGVDMFFRKTGVVL